MGYSIAGRDKERVCDNRSDRPVGWLLVGWEGITVAQVEAERHILAQRVRRGRDKVQGAQQFGEQRAGVGGMSRRAPPEA